MEPTIGWSSGAWATAPVCGSNWDRDRVIRFRSIDDDTVVGTLGTGRGSGPTEFQRPQGLAVLDGVFCLVCVYFNWHPYFILLFNCCDCLL